MAVGLAVFLSLGLTAAAKAAAAGPERPGEIGILGGGMIPDDDLTREGIGKLGGFSVGVGGGYRFANRWHWFVDGLYSQFDSAPLVVPTGNSPCCGTYLFPVEETLRSYSFRTGAKYHFGNTGRWNVAFGGGWMKVRRHNQVFDNQGRAVALPGADLVAADFSSTFGSVGLGQRFFLGRRSAIGWEVRVDRAISDFQAPHEPTDADIDPSGFFLISKPPGSTPVTQAYVLAGFSWGLGKVRAAKAEVEQPTLTPPPQPAVVADTDGDGVPDPGDVCPGTPPGTPVGTDGCPRDGDGDGVPDSGDVCPNTAPGTPVGTDGCPRDGDGDGVPDSEDRCPATPPGTAVNLDGCPSFPDPVPAGAPLVLEGVKFKFDSAVLTADSLPILNRVAASLHDAPGVRVEIGGHTCSIGTDRYDAALSLRRADAVRVYLIGRGVAATQLEVEGYGKSRPIATNETEEGREQNRRVELTRVD